MGRPAFAGLTLTGFGVAEIAAAGGGLAVKIRSVTFNNRRRDFAVRLGKVSYRYPYVRPRSGRPARQVATVEP